jgi:hypothetical protein
MPVALEADQILGRSDAQREREQLACVLWMLALRLLYASRRVRRLEEVNRQIARANDDLRRENERLAASCASTQEGPPEERQV